MYSGQAVVVPLCDARVTGGPHRLPGRDLVLSERSGFWLIHEVPLSMWHLVSAIRSVGAALPRTKMR